MENTKTYGFIITNKEHDAFVSTNGTGTFLTVYELCNAKVFSSPEAAKNAMDFLRYRRWFERYTWVVSELGFANEHNLELATLREENAKLKEDNKRLKRQHDMACGDVGKFTNRNIDLRKEVKKLNDKNIELSGEVKITRRELFSLQRQLNEAAADRRDTQFKLAIKDAELTTLADSFHELGERWSDLTTIEHVIFNDPATIVFWKDGTKTIVKNSDRKKFDPEKGLAMAICKKLGGNKGSYYDEFKKWLPKK